MTESFPRQQARTQRFTLGLPRSFQISPAGDRVAFLRSRGGFPPRCSQPGRPHSVLPLSGVTHMTPQEEVAENLLVLQVDFLRNALGVTTGVASLTGLETGS